MTPLFELKKIQSEFPKVKVFGSNSSADFIRQFYGDDIAVFESFFLLLLNNQHQTIGYAKISQGGITSTVVDVRIIAKYVVDSLATAVIICHNHPGGTNNPSDSDISITQKVKSALELFDVTVLDHIILMPNGEYYSFADNRGI